MSSELHPASALLSLVLLAGAALRLCPSRKICGFDRSLRVYVLSQPVILVFASLWRLARLFDLLRKERFPFKALSTTILKRIGVYETRNELDPSAAQDESQSSSPLHLSLLLDLVGFLVGGFWSPVKIFATSGLLWTKVWAACFVFYCAATTCANLLEDALPKTQEPSTETSDATTTLDSSWIDWGEYICRYVAVFLQLTVFAFVDLKPIRPDKDVQQRYLYRFFRLLPHLFVSLSYIRGLEGQSNSRWPNFIHGRKSILVLSVMALVVTAYFVFLDAKYTLLYSAVTVCIPLIVRFLSEFEFFEKNLNLGAKDTERSRDESCFALDLFVRLVFFSIYGYVYHYHPEETSKPSWLEWMP